MTTRSLLRFPFLTMFLLVAVVPARASAFTATEQNRFVESAAGIGALAPSSTLSAADFGLFEETILSEVSDDLSFGTGRASQMSTLSQDFISSMGSVFTSGFSAGLGLARSDLEIVFELAALTNYTLDGSVSGESDAFATVRLLDSAGASIHTASSFDFGNGGPGGDFAFAGVLTPGTYTLRAFTTSCSDEIGFCGQGVGFGSYSVGLVAVPEPSTAIFIGIGLSCLAGRRRG